MKRILLAYSVPHSGHSQAAAALCEAFTGVGVQADEFNLLDWSPHATKIFPLIYRGLVRHAPRVWGHFHGNTHYRGAVKLAISTTPLVNWWGLRDRAQGYDAVVCTHFFQTQLAGEMRKRGLLQVPAFSLPTDFRAHAFWANQHIDGYCAPTLDAQLDLTEQGIDPKKIRVTGIPVKQAVLNLPTKDEARKRLGIEPGRTVALVVGGSYGFFPFEEIVSDIVKKPDDGCTWLILTSSNETARRNIRAMLPKGRELTIRALGFQPDMGVYLAAADVAVSKPGGIFSSEALAAGLPLVIHKPIPGQEEQNARYLIEHDAALSAHSAHEIVGMVRRLTQNRDRLLALQAAAKALGKPDAGKDAVRFILNQL